MKERNKRKNKLNFIKIETYSSKDTIMKIKRNQQMRGNICTLHIRGPVFKLHVRNIYESMSKTQTTQLKMGKGPDEMFIQRGHINGS